MNKHIHDLLMNIFGGFLVAVIDRLIIYFQKYFKGLGFKKIFGGEINDYYIVYGKMILNPIYSSKDNISDYKGEFVIQFANYL